MSEQYALADIPLFSPNQHAAFRRGGYETVLDLFLSMPQDIAKKCRVGVREANEMLDMASSAITKPPRRLSDIPQEPSCFTTGDDTLDKMLGGGIRTGMLWEIVGEGASGKTQLALQLSLCVQLPSHLKGLSGSTCYLTTYSGLPTPRLVEIYSEHPAFRNLRINALENITTLATKSSEYLKTVLAAQLPALLADKRRTMPVKLLVIDVLADLFSEDGKTTTSQLAERSRGLGEISALLHGLASQYGLAVVVLNRVVDVFEYTAAQGTAHELVYAEQAKLFSSGNSVAAEQRKKAALGLVWANQVNARIMLTRTNRRRMVEGAGPKRPRISDSSGRPPVVAASDDDILIRRLSILFSTVSPPSSTDFIVTQRGVELLADDIDTFNPSLVPPVSQRPSTSTARPHEGLRDVESLDVAAAQQSSDAAVPSEESSQEPPVEDEEELYWRGMDEFSSDALLASDLGTSDDAVPP
ncbi:unnamed protein product [Peniophora sp. CBMAI 1063]|nr:unnamed protein product [Peniophora sp. CBMAI 1063]